MNAATAACWLTARRSCCVHAAMTMAKTGVSYADSYRGNEPYQNPRLPEERADRMDYIVIRRAMTAPVTFVSFCACILSPSLSKPRVS